MLPILPTCRGVIAGAPGGAERRLVSRLFERQLDLPVHAVVDAVARRISQQVLMTYGGANPIYGVWQIRHLVGLAVFTAGLFRELLEQANVMPDEARAQPDRIDRDIGLADSRLDLRLG